jgi:hypothetical protein
LPYLEQTNLQNQYNFSKSIIDANNQRVISTHLKVMQCPSTPKQNRLHRFTYPAGSAGSGFPTQSFTWDEAAGDYAPTSGVRGVYANTAYANSGGAGGDRHGVLRNVEASRMAQILDGTSNTLLIGELAGRNDLWAKVNGTRTIALPYPPHPTAGVYGAVNYAGGWGNPLNGENWLSGSLFSFASNLSNITQEGPCGVNCSNLTGRNLFSFHAAVAQGVLADGSVRGFSESINGQVLAFMITREKGETIPGE